MMSSATTEGGSPNAAALGELLPPVVGLAVVILGYAIMLRLWPRNRRGPNRGQVSMRTLTGPNVGLVLATLAVARFLFEAGTNLGLPGTALPLLVLISFGLVVSLVVMPRLVSRVLNVLGLMAFVAVTFIELGPRIGLDYLVVSVALLVALGVVRLVRPDDAG